MNGLFLKQMIDIREAGIFKIPRKVSFLVFILRLYTMKDMN